MNAIEWLYFSLIINLLIGLSSWKLFKISGKNAFTSIIPFYNIINIQNGTFRVDLKIPGGKRTQLRDIVKNYTQLTD